MNASSRVQDLASLRERYLAAQLRGDRREASSVVFDEALPDGASVHDVYEHIVQAAQREIGRLWQENVVTIAQEHMATAISNLVLTQLFEKAPHAPRNGKRILLACVEGEQHELPARLVCDALDLAGFDVRYLGANVPCDTLVPMIALHTPDLVALSVTMSFHAGALRKAISCIRQNYGRDLPIAAGGHALDWGSGIAADLGIDITAKSTSELLVAVKQRLGVEP